MPSQSKSVAIVACESFKNSLPTPFKANGAAAIIATGEDGKLFLHRMRHTNYGYIAKFIAGRIVKGAITTAYWVEVDKALWEEFRGLVNVKDGTVYASGRMPANIDDDENPDATGTADSSLPKVERLASRMGYAL